MKTRLEKNSWILTRPSAHRGLHDKFAPENSLLAYENACKSNYPIELDLQMTTDGEIVCFHDDNLKRVTGFDCDIRKTDYQTLKSLRLFETDCQIPHFSKALELIDARVPILIEIKKQLNVGIVEKTLKLLDGYTGEFAIQSFDPRILKTVKKLRPEILRGQLGSAEKSGLGKMIDFALKWLPLNRTIKPDFVNYNIKNLPISRLVHNNLPVLCWTVRTYEEMEKAKRYAVNFVFEHVKP